MKSTIIANELQLLEFGKVVVVIDIVIITLVAPTPNVLEGLNSQVKVYVYASSKIQNDSDDTYDDNDSYLRTNIGCK